MKFKLRNDLMPSPRIVIAVGIPIIVTLALLPYPVVGVGIWVLCVLSYVAVKKKVFGILGLAIYIPFENFLLKWLPVSDYVYSMSRYVGEFWIYLALIATIISKTCRKVPLKKTPIDIPLALFLCVAIISTIANGVPLIDGFVGLRGMFRYVALFYIIANLNPREITNKWIKKLIISLVIIAAIEALVGFAQKIVGAPLNNFLLPRQSVMSVGSSQKLFTILTWGTEIGAIFATFGHVLDFACYELLAVTIGTVFCMEYKYLRLLPLILLSIFAIPYGFSRAVTISVLGSILAIAVLNKHLPLIAVISGALIVVVVLMPLLNMFGGITTLRDPSRFKLSPIEDIMQGFSGANRTMQNWRIGLLLELPRIIIQHAFWVGYGPDLTLSVEYINLHWTLPYSLHVGVLRDIYWLSIVAQFGIIGFVMYLWMFLGLFRFTLKFYATSKNKTARCVGLAFIVLLIVVSFLNFILHPLHIRAFSFYFWLFAGLVVLLKYKQDRYTKHTSKCGKMEGYEPDTIGQSSDA